jgi:outer membrane protein OmpA-like peptidoglycan-associated protein
MKKGIALAIMVILSVGLFSESHAQMRRLREANKLYNKMAYYYAAEAYEDVLARGVDSLQLAPNLADCYDKIENNEKAVAWYELIERRAVLNSRQLLRYAMVLRQVRNYDLSLQKFMEYEARFGSTELTRTKIAEHYLLERYGVDEGRFEIRNQSGVNTNSSDIGIAFFEKGKVFVSNATRTNYLANRTYNRMGNKFYSLYTATVDDEGNIGMAKRMRGNTKYHDGPAIFCPVNKVVYFTRSNYIGGKKKFDPSNTMRLKLFRGEIKKGKIVNTKELAINSDLYSTGHPAISLDGKTLFFASDRPGGFGGTDIWKVSIDSEGNTGNPINMGYTVNTSQNEMFPYIESTNNMLFFSSDGHTGLGGLDIFYGYMNEAQTTISGLTNMGVPMNSEFDDFGFLIDGELEKGYFISNRYGGNGDDDVYSFKMLKKFVPMLSVEGLISDCADEMKMLPGATVFLKDARGRDISRTVVSEDGYYRFLLDPTVQAEYQLEASLKGYESGRNNFSTVDLPEGTRVIERNICLSETDMGFGPAPDLALKVIVKDKQTQETIEGAKVMVIDEVFNRQILSELTSNIGEVNTPLRNKRLLDDLIFRVRADKSGYRGKIVDYASVYEQPGIITIIVELDKGEFISDGQEIVGCDGKKYVLNPIYFDLDKSDIRPDAARELDKIVELLNVCEDMRMEIGSHTDCRHSYSYNEALSQRRAQATLAYIKPRIKNPGRLTAVGYGERKLAVDCPCEPTNESSCSEELHQLNRRTEFKVLSVGTKRVENSQPNSSNNGVQVQPNPSAQPVGSNSRNESGNNNANSNVHVVQENETLYSIALKAGISVERLKAINGLKSDVIRPGQRLKLS